MRSMDRAGKCYTNKNCQPTRIDYISLKRWAAKIRRFGKSPLRVSSPTFWTLPLHLEEWNLPFLMELGDFFFSHFYFAKIRAHKDLQMKSECIKKPSWITSIMENFCALFQCKVHLSIFHSSPTSKIWYTST